jgi:hypothetical protein
MGSPCDWALALCKNFPYDLKGQNREVATLKRQLPAPYGLHQGSRLPKGCLMAKRHSEGKGFHPRVGTGE